jgi:Fic family protein
MTDERPEPLASAEASAIDAQYRPFPSFGEWSREIPRPELWEHDLQRFQEASENVSAETLKRAQEIAIRAAAFDTGAIEGLYPTDRGLTLTVATQAAAWEQEVDNRSEDARELFEAQLSAVELVLDLVADRFPSISQAWIRRLHEEITAPQVTYEVQTPVGPQRQPLPRGKYKEHPNHVKSQGGRVHAYAPVDRTQAEMQRFLDELDRTEFIDAHPVLQASYAHYALVAVHPFADGNGRLARAIASAYTYRAASVPLLVLAHQRDAYFAALGAADSGDPDPFVGFTASAIREAVELVTETLKTAQAPQPESVLENFKELLLVQGDLTHQQLDQVANEFVDVLVEIISQLKDSLVLPDGVGVQVVPASGGNQNDPPNGFRSVVTAGPRSIELRFDSAAPARARHLRRLDIYVATGSDPTTTLFIRDVENPHEYVVLSLDDLRPQLSSAARLRVASFVRRLVGRGLSTLLEQAEKRLRGEGY